MRISDWSSDVCSSDLHLLAEREKFHSARIVESLAATSPETTQRLASVGAAFARMSADPVSAQNAASASLARAASGQAFTLAFSDTLIVTAAIDRKCTRLNYSH